MVQEGLGWLRRHQRAKCLEEELREAAVAEAEATFGTVVDRMRELKNNMATRARAAEAATKTSERAAARAKVGCNSYPIQTLNTIPTRPTRSGT